ncbi:ORF6N domain-containing protein [Olivibacter sp. 47]|uniref:ORF6N domain-containing protein n=1 Tax=Olivibacter sp. 47 TaxID=3056486 RepID=UPI0025A331CB|nr:ORF6N domain-containing protein [Olivibacter sp. 47]MDM8178158.1 ORF6N domain-containing protein [Olivibacter sp. 47]
MRGHSVMLDSDLSTLYGVQTKVLNQAVRRNIERFPEDFMFQINQGRMGQLAIQVNIRIMHIFNQFRTAIMGTTDIRLEIADIKQLKGTRLSFSTYVSREK